MRRVIVRLVALAALALVQSACARATGRASQPPAAAPAAPLPSGVVAAVGTRTVPLDALRRRVVAAASGPDPCVEGAEPCPEVDRTIVQRALSDLVDELTARHHADRTGVRIEPAEVDAILDTMAKKAAGSKDELFAEARRRELEPNNLRAIIEGQMLVAKVWSLGPGKEPLQGLRSDDEKRAAMAKTYAAWRTDPRNLRADVRILALYVAPGREKYVSDFLQSLRGRAERGEDFCKLVALYVPNDSMRASCGSMGPVPLALLLPEVRRIIQPMKAMEVSGPHRVTEGMMILQLVDRPSTLPLEDVWKEVWTVTATRIMEEQRSTWLRALGKRYGARAELTVLDAAAIDREVQRGRALRTPEMRQRQVETIMVRGIIRDAFREWAAAQAPAP